MGEEENDKEYVGVQLLRAEIRHLKELLIERDKALQLQASFYEKEKTDLNNKVESLIAKNNRLIGWIAGVVFIGGMIIVILNYFKK